MSDQTVKQQIADKLKDVENVLVTVNNSPSVDELSAALGFTLLLNKLNKHATAVFSGAIPPAITFLDPEKTFEDTVDSLRDFIIALDKEKADHLRYKVDGDMVKIFITPYRTVIDDGDLEFSQGEYNVEMVVAIGVKTEDDLDRALADHGRIMHDATVASLSIDDGKSKLGSLNWHEPEASSYSEMLMSIAESLRNDKTLIDEQIATAFLTGIVAATDRFSNQVTNSKVMTMAAQLMAAGANQQLIATKLEEAKEIDSEVKSDQDDDGDDDGDKLKSDGSKKLTADVSTKLDKTEPKKAPKSKKATVEPVEDKPAADGSMKISHTKSGTLDEVAEQTAAQNQAEAAKKAEEALAETKKTDSLPEAEAAAATEPKEAELEADLRSVQEKTAPSTMPSVADLQNDLEAAAKEVEQDATKPVRQGPADLSLPEPSFIETPVQPQQQTGPSLGGTLNATTEQAAEAKRQEILADRNKAILSHGDSQYVDGEASTIPPVNSFNQTPDQTQPEQTNALFDSSVTAKASPLQPSSEFNLPTGPTLEELDRQNRGTESSDSDPKAAIEQALNMAPSMEQQQQAIPTTPSFGQSSPQPQAQPPASTGASGSVDANNLPPLPPMPPMPDFSTLPPLPGADQPPTNQNSAATDMDAILSAPSTPPQPVQSNDPAQFRIPS